MRYETVKTLNDEGFKRSTGVRRSTFAKMLKVVEQGWRDFGRPPKLSRADQLLMTLMYWREYRTEFHIGLTYGVSESTVCRTVKKVEDALLKSEQFHLPGKKKLRSSDTTIEIVLVDATEQPIERPQKNNASITAAKRSGACRKRKSSRI
jgi:Helix-turn-helix of DDE superfamily endonuclease